MIRLFIESEEKNKLNTDISKYNHNKYVLTDTISCIVTETVDGIFDLDLIYPLNDNKDFSKLFVRGNVIKCPISQTDSRGEQLFTIRKRNPSTKDNRVTIYAQAKARRDLDLNMVVGMRTTGTQTRKQACQMLLNACVEPHNYTIGNLDTNTNTTINLGLDETTGNVINYLDINGLSPRTGFLSETENSISKAFGGEIIYNNFELNMVEERGTGNTILIKSGKNLEDLQQEIDDTDLENLATAIMPCSADGYYLPNSEIIYSPNASVLGKIFKKIVFDDVTLVNDTPEAIAVVYAQLRERVQAKYNEGMDKLKINNTINFIQLANTEEYKNYASLEKCEIGNNVIVRYYKRNDANVFIEATGRVVKIKFNVLKNKIEEVEVGDRKKKSIVDTINYAANKISNVNEKANVNTDKIKKAKKYATDYADSSTNGLKVVLEARDTEIEASVTNEAEARVSAINILDGAIKERVTTADYNAEIDILVGQIQAKVEKEGFGAYLKMFYNEIMASVYDGTNHNVILNGDGLSVENGAFTVRDGGGNIIFRVNTEGAIGVKDISIEAQGVDSAFYGALQNLDGCNLESLSINTTLYIHGDSIEQIIDDRIAAYHA